MTCLAKHDESCMRILRIVVKVSGSQPDGVVATVDLPPALFTLLGSAHFTGPVRLLFTCFRSFIPVMWVAFFVPRHLTLGRVRRDRVTLWAGGYCNGCASNIAILPLVGAMYVLGL